MSGGRNDQASHTQAAEASKESLECRCAYEGSRQAQRFALQPFSTLENSAASESCDPLALGSLRGPFGLCGFAQFI
jgi:hypothetical protein